ncbi:MAG: DUF222 domain-containing protein [Ilumatobacteraceae bacterium]
MKTAEAHELVERLAAVDAGCADWASLRVAVDDVRRLRSWVDGREVAVARAVAGVSSFPEKSLAEAGRTSLRHGEQVLKRADTVETVPEFGASLDAGRVSGEHVDVMGRALRQLDPAVRQQLVDQAPILVTLAENVSADEFGRAMRAQARRLERDSDGLDRLERQKCDVRFSSWIECDTGMGRWSATWDPETMLRLENRIDATLQALFHDSQPDGCPSDLLEKQSFLRAQAVLAMLDGRAGKLGKPEIVVVVDHTQPDGDGRPSIDWGLDVELPDRVLTDLAQRATVHTVVVRNGVVIAAPGELNQGRQSRTANRAQRRALRALYPSCAIPGCRVRFSRTKAHHVIWWRHDGLTDLDNLLPVCEHHHHKIHNDGWLLTLTPDRTLTIKLPDGNIMTTGPPKRGAA